MVDARGFVGPNAPFLLALGVLAGGIVIGYAVGKLTRRVLVAIGVPEMVEGTSFERTVGRFGTSTVGLFGGLTAWFIYGLSILLALQVANFLPLALFWARFTNAIPDIVLAVLALGIGLVLSDKAELTVSEYLRGVKLPEVSVIPRMVKYSVIYLAVLIALGQVGVSTGPLLVLFGVYAVAVIVFVAIAVRDLFPAATAGVYLLLTEPYSIGDTVVLGGHRGVIQEVSVFVTYIENDGHEYIVPNHLVLREGIVRVRN